jgi:hypothetical protein
MTVACGSAKRRDSGLAFDPPSSLTNMIQSRERLFARILTRATMLRRW